MIVSKTNFFSSLNKCATSSYLAVDCETFGLNPYKQDKLFSIILADENETYYFNFLKYDDLENCPDEHVLNRELLKNFQIIFDDPKRILFFHNAKFDWAFLSKEGLEIKCVVHCTQAIARVEYNAHFKNKPYSLASCAERIGFKKDDTVENYISKHHLWEWEKIPGKIQRSKIKFFDKVPFEIMAPYGSQDGFITRELGLSQIKSIKEFQNSLPENIPGPLRIMENERRFTRTCFNMEQTGVLIDKEFCYAAADFEKSIMEKSSDEFLSLTGRPLVNSAKELAPIFKNLGETFPKTQKGNDSFTKEVLTTFKSREAQVVKDFRKAEKRAAYFYSYIYYADKDGLIHADIKQSGTEHGRVSYGNPNFQNVPKRGEDKSPYPVRRAIIPPPGFILLMPDYDQMEYKLMIDYANEPDLIKQIKNGEDLHRACANLMEIEDREYAKTMNFLKLYGGGAQKLADALGVTLAKAKELSNRYWERLPNIAMFIQRVSEIAKKRGYVINWMGRKCNFPNSEFAYAAPNHLISGGCADIVKLAMNKIDDLLVPLKSKMLIQVHDEIVFKIHESELHVVPLIKEIMESVYPYKHLPLTCGIDHSQKSWFDKIEGMPN